MKLEVVYNAGDSSAASPGHCSVSLPVAVASSLAGIQPFAALVILKLEPVSLDIPAFGFRSRSPATAAKRSPVFVAWTGATVDKPYSIGFHPAFAQALGLTEGTTVAATIVERVVSKRAGRTVRTATLRPVVYDACDKVPDGHKQRDSDCKAGDHDPFESAVEQFSMLSGTADALERSILAQVRVLFVGLVFPLRLPGRDSVPVRVVKLQIAGESSPGNGRPYALLVPDSEVEVESPPIRASNGKCERDERNEKCVSGFYRVLSHGKSSISSLPPSVGLTHAVLPADDAGPDAFNGQRYALVSRKGEWEKQTALPVAFTFHAAIPARHVSLPPALWKDLKLTPLTPVLVDEVPPFRRGEQDVNMRKLPENSLPWFPSFEQFAGASAVYYDGMCLQDMQVSLSDADRPPATGMQLSGDIDLWDKEGIKEQEGKDAGAVDDLFAAGDTSSLVEFVQTARSKRGVREGLRSFPGQTLLNPAAPANGEVDGSRIPQLAPAILSGRPLKRVETQQHSLLSLTMSGRTAIEGIVGLSRTLFCNGAWKSRSSMCKAAVLEGPVGSGKTHICKAVSSLLRELANVRTIWIRGKVHAGERDEVSLRRIRRAFAAATDGGPGVVVLDDIDMLFGNRKSNQEGETDTTDEASKRGRHVVAQELEIQINRAHVEPVLLLMTCEKAKDLETSLRSPGNLRSVVSLQLPTAKERTLLYWMALQELNCTGPTHEELLRFRREVSSLQALSQGYSAKDIHVSLKRARIALELASVDDKEADIPQLIRALKDVLKTMTPSSRSGISFSKEKVGESLTWSRIGALENAKSAIWEALQLPSVRPDVFSKVPIRLPHGILLYGPPGCGKTMLARTAAVESGMRCVMVKGPELLSKYIGESEAEVRRAFEKAASSTPCVLLFDEFDSLAPRRGGENTGVADRVVNTLLTCMDGAERLSEGVYIIATTSRPELIDPALLRPGRLDRWIPVHIPSTVSERKEIMKCLSARFFAETPLIEAALEQLARDTDGYTGADLGAIMNDAHLRYGKQTKDLTTSCETSSIPELLNDALRQSRPSLSRSQREYYMGIMNRFSPQESRKENGLMEGNKQKTAQLFGKRVALQ